MNEKCESCIHYTLDHWHDYVCGCAKSDRHGIETEPDDKCSEWEGKA